MLVSHNRYYNKHHPCECLCLMPGNQSPFMTKDLQFQSFLFNSPLKKSKLLLSLCNCHIFPVGRSSQPNSSATNIPKSLVIPLIFAFTPPSASSVTI